MSLDWNVSKIKNADEVCWEKAEKDVPSEGIVKGESYMKPLTNALIWTTMAVDLGTITEANIDEWIRRCRALEANDAPILRKWNGNTYEPLPITREMLESHIGLRTNVPNTSPAKFDRKMREIAADRAKREARQREAKKAAR
jgi:hypothetical protein